MSTRISVILCTHNPRKAYLDETLAGLRAQTLSRAEWELLIIDNVSEPAVATTADISWHENARIIPEPQLGLTPARLRGIRECTGDLIVFVDDDNILQNDYLQRAAEVAQRWLVIGVWSGQLIPRFEKQPEPWAMPQVGRLALRTTESDQWFKLQDPSSVLHLLPFGAGMCVRKNVAENYAQQVENNPVRKSLGRRGKQLDSAEDLDLGLTAFQMGLGCAVFRDLSLTHLIPAGRVTEEYLLRLVESQEYSSIMLMASRGKKYDTRKGKIGSRLIAWYGRQRMDPRARKFQEAVIAGRDRAYRDLSENGGGKP